MAGVMNPSSLPVPVKSYRQRSSVRNGGGSEAVRGGAAAPDVDVLFAQAGQLRSQGLSRDICSQPQLPTFGGLDQLCV